MTRLSLPLAPMSGSIRWLTIVFLVLPFALLTVANLGGVRGLNVPAALLLGLYAAVWLFIRPTRFELANEALEVVFPAWTRRVDLSAGATARSMDVGQFRQAFGTPLRVGVGGLWGGFGWLWTSRRGRVEFYVSRTDGLVLVEPAGGRPILISPETPERLVSALRGG